MKEDVGEECQPATAVLESALRLHMSIRGSVKMSSEDESDVADHLRAKLSCWKEGDPDSAWFDRAVKNLVEAVLKEKEVSERRLQGVPAAGERCSFTVGSDVYPCTVVEVKKNGREVVVCQDTYRVVRVQYPWSKELDVKLFTHNPKGPRVTFTLRRDGQYRRAGDKHGTLVRGGWDAYQDPHF